MKNKVIVILAAISITELDLTGCQKHRKILVAVQH